MKPLISRFITHVETYRGLRIWRPEGLVECYGNDKSRSTFRERTLYEAVHELFPYRPQFASCLLVTQFSQRLIFHCQFCPEAISRTGPPLGVQIQLDLL